MAKAAKKPADTQEDSILSQLAANSPPPEPESKSSVDVDALMAKIAALESNIERVTQTNMALMTQPPAPAYHGTSGYGQSSGYTHQSNTGGTPKMTFGDLPDPVLDKEGFDKALADRISGSIGAALQAQQEIQHQKSQESAQADQLWSRFESEYPDLAAHKRLVGLSAADVAADLKNRGVDVNRYMTVAGDEFLKQVADRVKNDFGPMVSGETDFKPAKQALRTAGVFGGVDGVGTSGAKPAEVELGSFTKDLSDLQTKTGYF